MTASPPTGPDLREWIREIPDFPRDGIGFKDITPLLLDPTALNACVDRLTEHAAPLEPDLVVAAEARGFVLGGALAARLDAGFIPARKPGKLPAETSSVEYVLEYGIDALEVHRDAFAGGPRVLVHDDLLATGGTASALVELVENAGASVVGCLFVVELSFLDGRGRLGDHDVHSLVTYDAE